MDTAPVRKRAHTSRSRVGCSTCRRRRVKCDEGYPHCLRCVKAKVPCEGYSSASLPTKALPTAKSYKRKLLPKIDVRLSTTQPTAKLHGETEVENRYLKYFHHETTSGFQSAYDWTLWNRIMLQGCHHEPFVRYAVVAIGALHKSLRTLSSTGQETHAKDTDPMARQHREFAYITYGKALKKMQQAIDTGSNYRPRQGLITCLLVVCFESHTGNRYKALTHARYGLQILQQWNTQCKQKTAQGGKSTMVSPKPIDVEDEIVEAFRNLDIQITTVNDDRKVEEHKLFIEQDSPTVKSMPSCFESLETARTYWNVVMRRSCHFMATVCTAPVQSQYFAAKLKQDILWGVLLYLCTLYMTYHQFPTYLTFANLLPNLKTWKRTRPDLLCREFETKIPGSMLITVGDTIHTTAFKVDDVVKTEQKRYTGEVSQWLKAFEPTFSRIRRTGRITSREYIIASILQIQALAQKITTAGVVFTQEILYDEYLPDFREIIHLSTDVATACHSKVDADFWAGSFLLDLGLIVPLFMLLLRCRDPILRRQAIEILENWHVECWWDPLFIIPIGRFIMEVEEEGMVDGCIPEEARAILTAKSHCPPQRGFLVQCVQRTGGPGGGLKWTEKFVRW